MCRCKACDNILEAKDFGPPLPDGSIEDLCCRCLGASRAEYNYVLEHEWIFGEFPSEGVTEINIEY